MTVDVVYRIMQFVVNKSQQGNLTPSQFNLIINEAQNEYLSFLVGNIQQYQYGKAVPRIDYSQNEVTRQKMTPLLYPYTLSIDNTGFSSYPYGFLQVDGMWKSDGINKIRFCEQNRLTSTYKSVIDKIADYPIYLLQREGFQFYPLTSTTAKLSYVKEPPQIVWAYTNDVNGRPIYDAANSVDPVFYDIDMIQVIVRALRMVGINLQENVVIQYAEQIKTQGQ